MTLRETLALVIATAAFAAPAAAQDVSEASLRIGGVVDLPAPIYRPLSPAPEQLLRRTHDLFQQFTQGEGVLTRSKPNREILVSETEVGVDPLPWQLPAGRADSAKLLTWRPEAGRNEESMLVMVLRDGESWCSSKLTIERGSRLRFEALSIEVSRTARLLLTRQTGGDSSQLSSLELSKPKSFDGAAQSDVALDGAEAQLCFAAEGGSLALGEARVLAPEPEGPEGEDPRPRWLVLTIIDALRGDVLGRQDATELFPALSDLASSGHDYRLAQSPGCHTRASVWPMLMGRDLMRIDPLRRRHTTTESLPLTSVFSRGNVFVSYLAQAAGYHSVFLGNNTYLKSIPAFSRFSSWGSIETGTQDTMNRLPDLFRRYADERLFLVFYLSTPHGQSSTPQRFYDQGGCGDLQDEEDLPCRYIARVRLADEAVAFLQRALGEQGLEEESYQIITADHGEIFGDAIPIEGVMPITDARAPERPFVRWDRGHGNTCHWRETHVPLLVHGKGIAPERWDERVSGLDLVPTLLQVMRLPAVGKLDGTVLPLQRREPPRNGERRFVAYGYCSHAVTSQQRQFIWWLHGCRMRELDGTPLEHRGEIWVGDQQVATDRTEPQQLQRHMSEHELWLRERLSSDAFVFGVVNSPSSEIRISVQDARIVDFGPSATVFGLNGIDAPRLSADQTSLSLRFHDYRGLYYVTTLPPNAPLHVEADYEGGERSSLGFVGPLQIPIELNQWMDPQSERQMVLSDKVPEFRSTERQALRFWWQPHLDRDTSVDVRRLSELDRVLREWGYIR